MLVLAGLAIAFLPLLIQGLKQTSENSTLATATQIVAQHLEQLRDSGTSCTAVKAYTAAAHAPVPHKSTSLQAHSELDLPVSDLCEAPHLRTVLVRIWVTETGSTVVLSDASALVLLDAP